MTNEEAIEILTELKTYHKTQAWAIIGVGSDEAIGMAIKALEDKGYEQGYADGFAECLELNT